LSEFSEAIQAAKRRAKQAITECCLMVEADAKLDCPVDTGTLRRSITHDVKQDDHKTIGSVGTNVEYAPWVDRKQPFLTSSIDRNMESVKRKIAEVLANEN
jgi:hypothetical protein